MKKQIFLPIVIVAVLLSSCTTLKVVETDPETGYFPTGNQANVITSVEFDLDSRKSLILAPNGDFTGNMLKNIGYFDRVINFEELERIVIENDLTDEISDISNRIGINKAAKAYQPFLWLRWDYRQDGNKKYERLVLTDPITLEDLFISETYLDYLWKGVNDQNNNYPAFNALIDYIEANSKTFRKK